MIGLNIMLTIRYPLSWTGIHVSYFFTTSSLYEIEVVLNNKSKCIEPFLLSSENFKECKGISIISV